MSTFGIEENERYNRPHATIDLRLDAPAANRVLLAIEHLDQKDGLDPALAELREAIKAALTRKSSGDTDHAPSTE